MKMDSEIYLSLVIHTSDFSLFQIEEGLGIQADHSHEIDSVKKNGYRAITNFWSVNTKSRVHGTKLDEHWDWLATRLKPSSGAKELLNATDALLDICGIIREERPSVEFSRASVKEIAHFGLSIGYDVYDIGP